MAAAASLLLAACATTSSGIPQAHPAAQMLLASAVSMIGQPYRFGGATPDGFDCSGLVEYAALRAGIRVPRTAAEQFATGIPVSRSELQPGDLVFMHLAGKELHVAIALDRQFFVHAPSSGGYVRIDSLIARPYAGAFIGARRVVSLAASN